MAHSLPLRIPSYLLRLSKIYDRESNRQLSDIITSSRLLITEGVSFDNWNGGIYGHDITLFIPIDLASNLNISEQKNFEKRVLEDIKQISENVRNEFIENVAIEIDDANNPECQKATPFFYRQTTNPDNQTFWKPGLIRLFISHRDTHKAPAHRLGKALVEYGVSSFVAHDTIKPLSEWRPEILKGLETMEVMLAFITADFEDSIWTNQEIGYALGKGIPIIPLKLGGKDPPGFISNVQALKGVADKPGVIAGNLFPFIADALGQRERLIEVLVNSFVSSPSWASTKFRFDRLNEHVNSLTGDQLDQIIKSYYDNDQLHGASYLNNDNRRILNFIEKFNNKKYEMQGHKIIELRSRFGIDDDIPF